MPDQSESEFITWLLQGPAWVRYRTLVELLDVREDDPEVQNTRRTLHELGPVRNLVASLGAWPGPALKSHKDSGHPLHALSFIADLGLRLGDPGVQVIVDRIMEHQAPEGPFQIMVNIPKSRGGTGEDQWVWMLCDAPLILYALIKLGAGDDPAVQAAMHHLVGLVRDNGWPCAAAPGLVKFRGPGRKADPCPYATLMMLKAIAQAGWTDHPAAQVGADALLTLWTERTERRPYLFAMGTHFARLKAPLVWFDLLHVADVLTRFPRLRADPRLKELVDLLAAKDDGNGRFQPESVWQPWKDWEFGQKREPSRWVTLLVQAVWKRKGNQVVDP